jgi:hypothetical protein
MCGVKRPAWWIAFVDADDHGEQRLSAYRVFAFAGLLAGLVVRGLLALLVVALRHLAVRVVAVPCGRWMIEVGRGGV